MCMMGVLMFLVQGLLRIKFYKGTVIAHLVLLLDHDHVLSLVASQPTLGKRNCIF